MMRIFGSSIFLLCMVSTIRAQVIEINTRLALFADDYLIDEMNGAELRLHHPKREGVALKFDKPWEGGLCGYVTVIHDNETYRMYYRGLPVVYSDDDAREVTCYAESPNGIDWTKPDLGIYEIDGTRDNNIILINAGSVTHNFSPFLDTRPGVPESERYKAVGGNEKSGLIAYISPDGIHWKKLREEPIITDGKFDSQNVIFWSRHEKQYICYFRTWTKTGYSGYRSVSRVTSKDFVHWSQPVEMDFGDTPREHIYTNQTAPYFRAPHIYISTAARFLPNKQALTNEQIERLNLKNPTNYRNIVSGCSDTVLMTSRGGNRYTRTFMKAFIRPGNDPHDWTARANYPALNVVPVSDRKMALYVQRNYGQPTHYLERLSLRTDGFISLHGGYEGGEAITKPVKMSGSELVLNYASSAAGSIQVELLDEDKHPLDGYRLEDCDLIAGDQIERVVTWNGNSNLNELQQPIRLRFVLKDADIYSMRFQD